MENKDSHRLPITYGHILKVALPLMFGTFVQSIVMITDSSFLSRYSTLSFDAAGNAGLVYVTAYMGLTGLSDAVQIILARRIGEKRKSELNEILQSSFFVLASFALLFFFFIQFGFDNLLYDYSSNKELAQEQIDFLSIRTYGFLIGIILLPLNSFFLATGKTWVIMVSSSIFACSNVLLDYLLIFGVGPIEPMGIKGAALASTLSEGITVIVLLGLLYKSKERIMYQIFSHLQFSFKSVRRIVSVGFPLLIQGFIALGSWTIFFTFIEQRSTYELTVSQSVRSVYMIAFIPIFGFAATIKTYVSQYMHEDGFHRIKEIIRKTSVLITLSLLTLFHGAILYPEFLISVINPDPIYLKDSAFILRIVFGSILIHGIMTPLSQTISGSGNTRTTLLIEIITIIVYSVYSYLALKIWDWNIAAAWSVEYLYFILMGILSLLYLKKFNWRKKKI
ncbi:MAG: MATE family efflux transporter [Brumimicrobium sp.]|nr:MATE family efflux transporter [Brumimicrobium sp.]